MEKDNNKFYALISDGMKNKRKQIIKSVSFWKERVNNHTPTLENIKDFLKQVPFDEKIAIYSNDDDSFYGELHSAYTPLYTNGAKSVDAIIDSENKIVWNIYEGSKYILNVSDYKMAKGGGVHTMPNGEVMLDSEHYAKGGRMSRSQKEYNKGVDDYKYFVVDLKNNKAVSGWEFKEDAKDSLSDYDGDKNFKVVGLSMLKSMGIENPKESFKMMAKGGSFIGKQKNLDRNKNGKIDSEDLRMIRENKMAMGGAVKYVDTKFSQNNSSVPYFLEFKDAVGSFAWKYGKYNEGILYNLSDFDKDYYSHLPLKMGEKLFRYSTDRMIGDSKYLIKINLDKGLIYFMSEENDKNDDKNIFFETRGIKSEYITLDKDKFSNGQKMAKGGGVGDNILVGQVYLNTTNNSYIIIDKVEDFKEEFPSVYYHTYNQPKSYKNSNIDRISLFQHLIDSGAFVLQPNKMANGGRFSDYKKPLTHEEYVKLAKENGFKSLEDSKSLGYRYNGEQWIDARNKPFTKVIGKYENGGSIEDENREMVLNDNNQIIHHTKELPSAIKGKRVPAWVVANVHESANNLSNATHYMDGQKMAKGGMVVTSIKDIPNFKKKLDEGKITYRGLGMGKLYNDFYKLAGTSGTRIKVDGKEYFITDEEFDTFSRGADGKMQIRFDAPQRKGYANGGSLVGTKVKVSFRKEIGVVKDYDDNWATVYYPDLGFSEKVNLKTENVKIVREMAKGGDISEDNKFKYMMLGRLQTDCDYYLGNGNRSERVLWAGNVDDHIEEMKKIWNSLPKDGKPEWLSMEDIKNYENKMKNNKMEKGGKIYSETMKTADGDIVGEVIYNDYYKTYQVVIDGVIYEEFKSKAEAIENLKNAGFGKMEKGGGIRYGVVDDNTDRVYIKSDDKNFIAKKFKELKEIYPNDKLLIVEFSNRNKMAKGGKLNLNTYKLRAEGLNDFLSFLQNDMYMRVKSFTIESIGVPDVVVSFVTDASLSEIKSKLEEVQDSHVMLETVKPINEYTGKRYEHGGSMGGNNKNGKYLDSIYSDKKSKILKNIANHYGISVSEAEEEVRDEEAEMLYEYIANDQSLRMDVYNDMEKGMMAKGGSINAKSIFKEYEENENDNYHAENILLLANNFGTEEDIETAKEILEQRDKNGSTSEAMNKKSYELNKKLYPKLMDALNSNKNQTTMTEEQIQKLVRGANGTNEVARNFSIKKLKEAGLDKNGKPLESKKEVVKSKTSMKAKTPSKATMTDEDYDCDEIIAEALRRKKNAKKSAEKSANKPAVVKAKEKVERTHESIEKQIEAGKLKKAQIEKIIAETEDLLRMLKKALKSL